MGFKRAIYSRESKHYWHISGAKVRRIDKLFKLIETGHNTFKQPSLGIYEGVGDMSNLKERREIK